MCGGRGTRLSGASGAGSPADTSVDDERDRRTDGTEKPLVGVGSLPMLDRVLAAVRASRVDRVHAVVSGHAPATRDRARAFADRLPDCAVVDAPGEGYVGDLGAALDAVGRPVVTVAADLPLLAPGHVDDAVATAVGRKDAAAGAGDPAAAAAVGVPDDDADCPVRSVTVAVPAALKRRLGCSVDTTFDADGRTLAPTGLNVVGDEDADDAVRVVEDPRLAINVNRPADLDAAAAQVQPPGETPWLEMLPGTEQFGS
jgi:adenosylcobinamide-phosphate guanylyltransferase